MNFDYDYDKTKDRAFARGVIVNGYDGDTLSVLFTFDCGDTFVVTEHRYYNSGLPMAQNKKESFALLDNHRMSPVMYGLEKL